MKWPQVDRLHRRDAPRAQRQAAQAQTPRTLLGGPRPCHLKPLVAEHVLEFPGGYTRTTGPVIGRFLTELRGGRIVGRAHRRGPGAGAAAGVRPRDRRRRSPDEYVEVGPAGTVDRLGVGGRAARRPPARPAVRLGADQAGRRRHRAGARGRRGRRRGACRPALRVRPGLARASAPATSPTSRASCRRSPTIVSHRADRVPAAGRAARCRLPRRRRARRVPRRPLPDCDKVYVPYRAAPAPNAASPSASRSSLPDTGTDHHVRDQQPARPARPRSALRLGVHPARRRRHPHDRPRRRRPRRRGAAGHAGRAVWVPESERTLSMANVRWFAPTGEPDVTSSYGAVLMRRVADRRVRPDPAHRPRQRPERGRDAPAGDRRGQRARPG